MPALNPHWDKYDCHPEIGPLIEEYRHSVREIEYLKQDLRTRDNMDGIVEASYESAELKRHIEGLVDVEETSVAARRRDTAWLFLTAIAAVVGLANVLIAFHNLL